MRFVNDSQGTQPDAVIAALRAFEPPIVLIAGGRDKGSTSTELAEVVGERAAAAVLIGESGPALERLFRAAGLAHDGARDTLEDAVEAADAIAREARSRDGRHGHRAAQPGRGQLRHVRGLRGPRPGVQGRRRADRELADGSRRPPALRLPPGKPSRGGGRTLTGATRRADRIADAGAGRAANDASSRRGRRRDRRRDRPTGGRGASDVLRASGTSPTTRSSSPSSPSPRSAS